MTIICAPEGEVQDVRVGPLWSAASLAPDPSRGPLRALGLPLTEEEQQAGVRLPQTMAGPALWGEGCNVVAHSDDKLFIRLLLV